MATNTHHLNLRAGAALAAVALGLTACAFGRQASAASTGSETTSPGTSSNAEAPATGGEARATSPCPLRFPSPLPSRQRVVPILMYHRIDYVTSSTPEVTRHLTVSPEDFRHQMRWLKRHGYHTITQRSLFNALMCGSHLPRKPSVITFDDGYRDVYRYAAPVIERFGMHAISYLITERISGDDHSFLSWKQVRGFEKRGVAIGSHTVSHASLTSLSDAGALAELIGSRKKLERKLDHRVPWLAYPYGDYDARIESLARKAGYKLAVTTDWGSLQSAQRPFALKRLRVLDSTGVSGLAAML
jgi:peptidoglycan/xylan/chitin deacetylase (PgdA/CDA1 family)